MNRRAGLFCAMGFVLFCEATSAWALPPTPAAASPNWKALILELLILLPLAALALKLRSRKRGVASVISNDEIKSGKPIRLANGAQAQLLYAKNRAVLVILGKDGTSSLLALDEASPVLDEPRTPSTNLEAGPP